MNLEHVGSVLMTLVNKRRGMSGSHRCNRAETPFCAVFVCGAVGGRAVKGDNVWHRNCEVFGSVVI